MIFSGSKGFSRGILSSMKADKNAIQLNGERGFGKSILQAGDSLHIHIPEADNTENILPVKMDLSILYEDEDILVINKAADMPVHPSIGNYDNTLANGVTWYFKEKRTAVRLPLHQPSGQRHHRSPDPGEKSL